MFVFKPDLTGAILFTSLFSLHIQPAKAIEKTKEDALFAYQPTPQDDLSLEKRLTQLDLAKSYAAANQFPAALAIYNQLLAENPKDCETRKELVQLYLSFARYDASTYNHTAAINWYLAAMGLNPLLRNSLLREYADQVSRAGNGPKAIELYEEALFSGAPASPEEVRLTYLGLAQTYFWINDTQAALKIYDTLLKINPYDKEARKGKAQVYLNYARWDAWQGNHTQAIHWLYEAIKADPEQRSQIIKELADQLQANSQLDEAINLYKEILSGNVSGDYERNVRLALGNAYIKKFLYDDALKQFDHLIMQNRYDGAARQGKAKVYLDYGDYNARNNRPQEAIDWYYKAITFDPILRPQLLLKIQEQASFLGGNIPPLSEEESAIKACRERLSQPPPNICPPCPPIQPQASTPTPAPTPVESPKAAVIEQKPQADVVASVMPKEESQPQETFMYKVTPAFSLPSEGFTAYQPTAAEMADSFTQSSIEPITSAEELPSHFYNQTPEQTFSAEEMAKKEAEEHFKAGQEYAKYLQVFEAKQAFETSLMLDPDNRTYREQYAWHLQTFSLFQEAQAQFHILLPGESDKTPYYEAMGWNYHRLGKLCEGLHILSNLYYIPRLTIGNQYILLSQLSRRTFLKRIEKLYCQLETADFQEELEIKKKIFELYTYADYLGHATCLAQDILAQNPDEYLVHYRYAAMLYRRRYFKQALTEFELLQEKLPDNAFLLLMSGKIMEDMGWRSLAQNAYQTALTFDQNPYTERALARILSKTCRCDEAFALSDQIEIEDNSTLTKELSTAEVSLNCGEGCIASAIYRNILEQYPYNQEALWGLLKSSTATGNTHDALISYRRWPTVWFEDPLQNALVAYYRPTEFTPAVEYFQDSTTFRRLSAGVYYSKYAFDNFRLHARYYYTQFSENHFNTIHRQSAYLGFDKIFNRFFEVRGSLIENYYDKLQHESKAVREGLQPCVKTKCKGLYSKGRANYHLHGIIHPLPEFFADFGYDYYDVIDTIPPFDNPIYNYSNQIGSAALNIRTRDCSVFLYYNNNTFYCFGNIVNGKYTDGNTKNTRSCRMGYRFCELPIRRIYYSYFYLNFSRPAPIFCQNGFSEAAYYDPKNFEIHSLGFESQYDATSRLQIGGEVALLYVPKAQNFAASGFGYFLYRFTDCLACRLDIRGYYQARGVTRRGITGHYDAGNVNFQIQYEY